MATIWISFFKGLQQIKDWNFRHPFHLYPEKRVMTFSDDEVNEKDQRTLHDAYFECNTGPISRLQKPNGGALN